MSYITRLSLICVSGITWQWIEVDSFKFKGKKIVRMLNMWFQKIENCKSACACGVGGWGGRVECCASKTKIFKGKYKPKVRDYLGWKVTPKLPPWERFGYFLQQHITPSTTKVWIPTKSMSAMFWKFAAFTDLKIWWQ